MLDKKTFLNVVRHTPLVSIDLIVRTRDDGILMGLRVNQPAAGYWFVPGGVIRKNETLETAFLRITTAELGQPITIDDGQLLGVFTHLYDSNFAHEPGVGTHYVVLAFELQSSLEPRKLPAVQHNKYRWIHQEDGIANVHQNSMVYFGHLTKME